MVRIASTINMTFISLKFGVPNFVGLSLMSLDLKSEIITVTIKPKNIKRNTFISEIFKSRN